MALLRSLTQKLLGNGRQVSIVVIAPAATPSGDKLYVTGACPELGQWDAAGKRLRQTDVGVWETRVRVPADQPIEFKVTRGSWETVEQHADGSDTGNHRVDPEAAAAAPIRHTVERWSDVA